MVDDPIVKSVRKARTEILKTYDNDIHKYFSVIKEKQHEYGERVVTLHPKHKVPKSKGDEE
jgi:hypothetical protein